MKNKNRKGNLLMALGLIFMLVAAALFGYNLWSQRQAGLASEEVLEKMTELMGEPNEEPEEYSEEEPAYEAFSETEMPNVKIDGDRYIGVLDIPALGLSLPVMSELEYKKLNIAPCRYSGSVYEGNLVIAGHNYSSHFGRLKTLKEGDKVTFTDTDGNPFAYGVSGIETLDGKSSDKINEGDWDLTLFTCTYSGSMRVTVRCILTDTQQ